MFLVTKANHSSMIRLFRILIGLLLVAIVGAAGCSTVTDTGTKPAAVNPAPAKQPAQLILLSEDIPQGFSLIENRTKNEADVSRLALDLGWREGYVVRYQKEEGLSSPPTIISQNIAVYPAENLPDILQRGRTIAGSQEQYTIGDLPDPGIGDISSAIVAYEAIKTEVTLRGFSSPGVSVLGSTIRSMPAVGQQPEYYEISFTRGDVYEIFRMSGPSADYKTLLELVKTAYEKT